MTFHWFGDSWVYGDELADKSLAYPYLVSKHLDQECKNYAVCASSVQHMLLQFEQAKFTPGEIAFFGITSEDRNYIYDTHLLLSANLHNDQRIDLSKNKQWYTYFDTKVHRLKSIASTLDLLKAYCKEQQVVPYFYNLFTVSEYNCKLLLAKDWLVGPNDHFASEIMHIVDNQYFTVVTSNQAWIKDKDWSIHSPLVDKYFSPNYAHPNPQGHQVLSERLINAITTR